MTIPTPQFFTVADVAKALKVSPRTIHRWIKRGVIHSTRVERTRRITGNELTRLTDLIGQASNEGEDR